MGNHRAIMWAERTVEGGSAMPQYVFLRQDCNKEFTRILHIAEMEKGGVVCPHCGGNRVTQQVAAFSVVTPRKS